MGTEPFKCVSYDFEEAIPGDDFTLPIVIVLGKVRQCQYRQWRDTTQVTDRTIVSYILSVSVLRCADHVVCVLKNLFTSLPVEGTNSQLGDHGMVVFPLFKINSNP